MSLIDYLHDTIGVNHRIGNEVQTSCPKCGGDRFYFNLDKKIGFCHKANCGWAPTLRELQAFYGVIYNANRFGIERPIARPPVEMPPHAVPVIEFKDNKWMSNDMRAYDYLMSRGISPQSMIKFDFQIAESRVYLPVRSDKELLGYVSRSIVPNIKGYLYPKGSRHVETLLGWEECKFWDVLTLVENSFVSIWLRYELNCTTNFGSHLSNFQIAKIAKSKIKKVVLLWDEGAEVAAEKSCAKLRSIGKYASYVRMDGQPDDHDMDKLIRIVWEARKVAETLDKFVDFKEFVAP